MATSFLQTTHMRNSSSGKGRGANLLLAVVMALLTLGGIEVALSLFFPMDYLEVASKDPDDLFREVLHQSSAVPGLSFELAPNRQKKLEGVWIRTNTFGMRDAEPQPVQDRSASRIVVLGDSFTFGYRVDGESSYPSVLEVRLNQGTPEKRFEVLNLGVSGYNTQDEALVLEHKGLEWGPDLVILGYVLNDPETKPVQPLNTYFQEPAIWQRSHLARLVAKAKRGLEVMLWGRGDYYRYLHSPGQDEWDGVVTALGDIQQLTESQGIPVLVAIFPDTPMNRWSDYRYADLHRQVAEASRERGFAVIDLLGQFSEYPARTIRVRRGDPHPSPLGHEVAAEAIHDWIVAELQKPAGPIPPPTPNT